MTKRKDYKKGQKIKKIKRVKVEAPPEPKEIDDGKVYNFDEFRAMIPLRDASEVVDFFVSLVLKGKLEKPKVCYNELKRRGFTAELYTKDVESLINEEK